MIDLRKPAKLAFQGKEQELQFECAKWLKKALHVRGLPQVFYHVANEGQHKAYYRAKMKAQGVLAGVPDIVLPLRSGEYPGLYLELKAGAGSPSKEQKIFLEAVAKEGYLALVVNDFDTFRECLTSYLDDRNEN